MSTDVFQGDCLFYFEHDNDFSRSQIVGEQARKVWESYLCYCTLTTCNAERIGEPNLMYCQNCVKKVVTYIPTNHLKLKKVSLKLFGHCFEIIPYFVLIWYTIPGT